MPSKRVLNDGDIVSIDFGAFSDGFYGDSAITVPVGSVSPDAARLVKVTEESLEKAIEAACSRQPAPTYRPRCRVSNSRFLGGKGVRRPRYRRESCTRRPRSRTSGAAGNKARPAWSYRADDKYGRPDVKILDDG
jgi:hypothetical protein